jgi:hypothetical protein
MIEAEETQETLPPITPFWWIAIAYAAVAGFGWLFVGMYRLLYWWTTQQRIEMAQSVGQAELAQRGQNFAGSLVVDMLYAFGAVAIFAFVLIALTRRSWNAWDYATVAAGFATVLTVIFLCARGRIMLFLPLSFAPLFALLYTPGVKAAMGVTKQREPEVARDTPPQTLSRDDLEREIAKERTLITQLGQNLDVFELERGMDTDHFVRRYTDGLEEETPDHAEWFAIARAVRRHRERLNELLAQRELVDNENV